MIGARIDVVGRLTRDPEMKAANSGTLICKGSIAYNLWGGEARGKESHFIDFVAFGKRAETIDQYVKKGHQVRLVGSLIHARWQNEEGKKFSKHEIRVDGIEFLEKKKDEHSPPDGHYEEMAPQPKSEAPPMGAVPENEPQYASEDSIAPPMSDSDIPF